MFQEGATPTRRLCTVKTALIAAALLPVIVAVGCSSGASKKSIPNGEKVDRILVVKSSHTLTLMAKGHPLKVYDVALGRGASGPKERVGDHKTPEGLYFIDQKNAQSRFHLSLHVSYPNASDRERASAQRLNPGGDIMVHGVQDRFAWLGALQHQVDWTDGCIAVTNPEIEEIWRLVAVGTPIEIQP
jgi:murein L,D-transpeptidase YafK